MFAANGVCNLFILLSTISQHNHVTWIIRPNRVFQVEWIDIMYHKRMLGLLRKRMLQALRLALGGDRRKWNQHIIDDQDDIGPRMSNDTPFAMIEFLGIVRMQTGTMLEGTLNQNRDFPRETMQVLERFGTLPGLRLGEALSRRDRNLGMGFEPLTALGCMQSRKPCRFFAGMLRRHDHQKEEITGADPLKTLTESDTTCDPSLQGASLHGASPL